MLPSILFYSFVSIVPLLFSGLQFIRHTYCLFNFWFRYFPPFQAPSGMAGVLNNHVSTSHWVVRYAWTFSTSNNHFLIHSPWNVNISIEFSQQIEPIYFGETNQHGSITDDLHDQRPSAICSTLFSSYFNCVNNWGRVLISALILYFLWEASGKALQAGKQESLATNYPH